jgi:hypothetical protein
MIALLIFLVRLLALPSKPKRRLEAENAALRRQVAVLQRKVRGRVRLTNSDRLFFVLLYRWFPSILNDRHQAGDVGALASGRLSALLAVEVEKPGRPAAPLFQLVMMPSRSMLMIASSEDSTMDAR